MLSQLLQTCSTYLLGNDKKQRRKTVMTALATAVMLGCAVVMRLLVESSGLNSRAVAWWTGFGLLGMVVILVLVRSGWSQRLADPSLSFVQMVWALSINAAGYVLAGPVRALALPVLVIIMMFGIFSHDRRQTWWVFFYALTLYPLVILVTAYRQEPPPPAAVVIAHFAIVVASLITSTLMCLQVQGIRRHLRGQKEQLEEAMQKIQDMAMRDDLTELINRRQMSELMALELARCQRSGRALVLAQMDIDHFKVINDTYGHAVGDVALKAFSQVATAQLREGDVLARWGGEEFVLLLGNTEPEAVAQILERIRSAVQAHVLHEGSQAIHMTVSTGWAQHQPAEALDETLQRADQALYEAKRAGRNRVVQAQACTAPHPRSE